MPPHLHFLRGIKWGVDVHLVYDTHAVSLLLSIQALELLLTSISNKENGKELQHLQITLWLLPTEGLLEYAI
jgi:hypothetical protein